jgi:hypothetical protein
MPTPNQSASGLLASAIWRKSSYSGTHGNCVEVATNLPGLVAVRDSKNSEGGTLIFGSQEWKAFVAGLQDGRAGDV